MSNANAQLQREVIDREHAEALARSTANELKSIFEVVPDLFLNMTADSKIQAVHGNWTELYPEFPASLGRRACDILPDLAADWMQCITETLATGIVVRREQLLTISGESTFFEVRFIRVSANNVLGVVRNITDRKQAAESLQQSERRFRAIVDHAGVGVAMADASTGRFITTNQYFCDMVGRSHSQLLSKTFMDITHLEDVPDSLKQMENLKTGRVRGFSLDKRYLRPDGSVVWCNLTASPLWKPGDQPSFIIAVVKDVTQQRLVEYERKQQQAAVAHVARVSVAGEMVAGIAHELNQPLTAITNFADACHEGLKGKTIDVNHQLQLTSKIMAQAHRAGEIIRRLRGLVRRTEPKRSSFDLREAVEQMLTFIEGDTHLSDLSLKVVAPDSLPLVVGDVILIQQLLLNLVRNALEAQLDQTDAPKEIILEIALKEASTIEVIVSDNGDADALTDPETLFAPFFTTKPEGIGLGLPISRSIAEAHHGKLWARKRPTRGLEFHFELPLSSGKVAP